MIGLIQRVAQASVTIGDQRLGHIDKGLLVFLGVEQNDTPEKAETLCRRIMNYRIFSDENNKMNFNVMQADGSLLVVSQFTLAADTKKGLRPSFSHGAKPELARQLYEHFVDVCKQSGIRTQTGEFAADMQVALINDGPVTFWLHV